MSLCSSTYCSRLFFLPRLPLSPSARLNVPMLTVMVSRCPSGPRLHVGTGRGAAPGHSASSRCNLAALGGPSCRPAASAPGFESLLDRFLIPDALPGGKSMISRPFDHFFTMRGSSDYHTSPRV